MGMPHTQLGGEFDKNVVIDSFYFGGGGTVVVVDGVFTQTAKQRSCGTIDGRNPAPFVVY